MGYAEVLDEGGAPEDEAVVDLAEKRKATYKLANQAFELISRHSTAPDPIAYAVWFAYVEGHNEDLNARIDKELSNSDEITDYEINEIYKTFLDDNDAFETNMNIGAEFEHSLAAASELMRESLKQNQEFSATLENVGESLPGAADPTELKSIVSDLVSENERMSQVTSELSNGLSESQAMIERLNKELEEFQDLSLRDPLTGVSNRRAFDARLKKEIQAANETGEGFCLVIADLDRFKRVNDVYGHQTGDNVLTGFAALLMMRLKGADMVARYGGEEFVLILPDTKLVAAHNLIVKILHELRETKFVTVNGTKDIGQITASFGICAYQPGMSATELIEIADTKLYEAKETGRNRVKTHGLN